MKRTTEMCFHCRCPFKVRHYLIQMLHYNLNILVARLTYYVRHRLSQNNEKKVDLTNLSLLQLGPFILKCLLIFVR